MLTRNIDEALAWRLAAEAADRLGDEAFQIADAIARGARTDIDARSGNARALAHLVEDLIRP